MRGLIFLLFIAFCLYLFVNIEPHQIESLIKEQGIADRTEEKTYTPSELETDSSIEGLSNYMGQDIKKLEEVFGPPNRKDLSSYDYEWWVYNSDLDNYIQFGVKNQKVVTIFHTGIENFQQEFPIGESYGNLNKSMDFQESVTVEHEEGSYQFKLKENERSTRPLIKVKDFYVQLYFDEFTQKLSSVRYIDSETIIKQRPYEMVYRGPLLEAQELTAAEWKKVEEGNARQIMDFTNIIRLRFDLNNVEWDEETSQVAYFHSKDMRETNYFSHTSPTKGSLSDRLSEGEIPFRLAGENIAAKYVDGMAAVEGWLNSEGHRNTLLNKRFTHLGVGVSEKYYTQNFIEKW
ncbi:Cysteine-rich secretory protein family protein [Bacillus sp. THAF10]|uniref:CAP domain-containing protein n=1 Tax=Bacillus sp. THAF10 TaxID=2587848 RepID=UPI00126943FF|nr:CAP domain-containing protein [Bacillus sp. THAF10]QFT88742.1 Cysteine-rich secretory protein family protein [Bacillus sp. THAF10]